MNERSRKWLLPLGWSALGAVTVAGCWLRLQEIDSSWLDTDVLHALLDAYQFLRGGPPPRYGEAVGFHYGLLQTWAIVPLYVLCGSFRQIFVALAIAQGLGTVAVGAAGQRLTGWGGGLLAATLYAGWPVLVDHGAFAAYTYLAPPLVALAVCGAAYALDGGHRRWLVVLAVAGAAAIHMHPYAGATMAASLVFLPRLARLHGWRAVGIAAGVGAVVLLPMVIDNGLLLLRDMRGGDDMAVLRPSVELFGHELGFSLSLLPGDWPTWVFATIVALPLAGFVAAPLLAPDRRAEAAGTWILVWAVLSCVLLCGFAYMLGYVRVYHLAVVLPVYALAVAWGWTAVGEALSWRLEHAGRSRDALARGLRLLFAGVALAFAVITAGSQWIGHPWRSVVDMDRVGVVDRTMTAVVEDAGDRAVAVALLGDDDFLHVGGIETYQADLWLRGAPLALDADEPAAYRAYVIAGLHSTTWRDLADRPRSLLSLPADNHTVIEVLTFEDVVAAEAWLADCCTLRDERPMLGLSEPTRSLHGLGANAVSSHIDAYNRKNFAEFCDHHGHLLGEPAEGEP